MVAPTMWYNYDIYDGLSIVFKDSFLDFTTSKDERHE